MCSLSSSSIRLFNSKFSGSSTKSSLFFFKRGNFAMSLVNSGRSTYVTNSSSSFKLILYRSNVSATSSTIDSVRQAWVIEFSNKINFEHVRISEAYRFLRILETIYISTEYTFLEFQWARPMWLSVQTDSQMTGLFVLLLFEVFSLHSPLTWLIWRLILSLLHLFFGFGILSARKHSQ